MFQPNELKDKDFKKRFEDFQIEPSDHLWGKIQANLNKENKPTKELHPFKISKYLSYSVAAVILLIVGFSTNILLKKPETATTLNYSSISAKSEHEAIKTESISKDYYTTTAQTQAKNEYNNSQLNDAPKPLPKYIYATSEIKNTKYAKVNEERLSAPEQYYQKALLEFTNKRYCNSQIHLTEAKSYLCEHDHLNKEIDHMMNLIELTAPKPCLCMVNN